MAYQPVPSGLFIGGLAWETRREALRRHFEQFGEILEAVVITEKNGGRSKGYGFVDHVNATALVEAVGEGYFFVCESVMVD
ncbi:hypothetical protein BT93_F3272 [Corymbia citriodora subsp. variegata]|nr:hypothetical protein BT93_F3272 [Corymbia citriodora subsp. variegata]